MSKYELVFQASLLGPMLKLEQALANLGYTCPVGIYSRYRFKPVIIPNKDYYLVHGNQDMYITFDEILKNYDKFNQHFLNERIFVQDDEGKVVARWDELSLYPCLPIRANMFLKNVFTDFYTLSRKWENNCGYTIDDVLLSCIGNKNLSVEEEDIITSFISNACDGLIEEVNSIIKKYGWHYLSVELEDDILRIFDLDDYRIVTYMEKHNRNDY